MFLLVSVVTYATVTGRIIDEKEDADIKNSVGVDGGIVNLGPLDEDEQQAIEKLVYYLRNGRSKRGIAEYASIGAGMVENKHYLSQGVEKGVGYFKGRSNTVYGNPSETTPANGSKTLTAMYVLTFGLVLTASAYGILKS